MPLVADRSGWDAKRRPLEGGGSGAPLPPSSASKWSARNSGQWSRCNPLPHGNWGFGAAGSRLTRATCSGGTAARGALCTTSAAARAQRRSVILLGVPVLRDPVTGIACEAVQLFPDPGALQRMEVRRARGRGRVGERCAALQRQCGNLEFGLGALPQLPERVDECQAHAHE